MRPPVRSRSFFAVLTRDAGASVSREKLSRSPTLDEEFEITVKVEGGNTNEETANIVADKLRVVLSQADLNSALAAFEPTGAQ